MFVLASRCNYVYSSQEHLLAFFWRPGPAVKAWDTTRTPQQSSCRLRQFRGVLLLAMSLRCPHTTESTQQLVTCELIDPRVVVPRIRTRGKMFLERKPVDDLRPTPIYIWPFQGKARQGKASVKVLQGKVGEPP